MPRFSHRVVPVVFAGIGFLVALLLTGACWSGRTTHGTTDVPVPEAATDTGPHSQPLVPRQFPEVAEAAWTVDQPLVGRELACRQGKARIFDCHNIDLLAYLPERVVGEEVTGLWGWTDPVTQREFVLAGHKAGTSVVEITDPVHPATSAHCCCTRGPS